MHRSLVCSSELSFDLKSMMIVWWSRSTCSVAIDVVFVEYILRFDGDKDCKISRTWVLSTFPLDKCIIFPDLRGKLSFFFLFAYRRFIIGIGLAWDFTGRSELMNRDIVWGTMSLNQWHLSIDSKCVVITALVTMGWFHSNDSIIWELIWIWDVCDWAVSKEVGKMSYLEVFAEFRGQMIQELPRW